MASEGQSVGTHALQGQIPVVLQTVATRLAAVAERLALLAATFAIVCLCALLVIVLAQILAGMLSRYFPAAVSAMSVSWEYAGYLMGAAFMLGMPQTLRQGGHIRVNLLFDALKPEMRQIADFIASAIAFVMVTVLATSLITMTIRSLTSNSLSTASLTPLWIPEGTFALATCLFAFQLLVRMVALIAGLLPEEQKSHVGAPAN